MADVDYVVVGLGALGSGAAWQLATRGYSVVGLEQFELGHARGASHDTSRILRHSYHTPSYVRLTEEAYDDWARLEAESGEELVTVVGGLGVEIPLTVTLEQPTYFAPPDPAPYQDIPVWIWMDEPSYYGFPCYGEDTVKAAQDCGGPVVDPDRRTSEPAVSKGSLLPGTGPVVRSLRCQYTLTPDRDFVMAPVPGHPSVVVGLGSAHGFKFAPTFGRILADLVTTGETTSDVSGFGFDRPGLTDPAYQANWMV